MNPDKNEWPLATSPPFSEGCWGLGCGTCVGGMRPRWTAVEKRWKGSFNMLVRHLPGLLTTVTAKWLTHTDLLLTWKLLTRTLASHADFDALSQPTVLTLVSVMLIDGAVARSSASVAEVTANAAFEKRLAAFTGKHTVVLSRGLVTTNCAFHLLYIFFRRFLHRFGLLRAPCCWDWNHGHTTRQIRTTDIIINPTVSGASRERERIVLPWLISQRRGNITRGNN